VDLIKQIEKQYLKPAAKTEFSSGDTVTVNYRIQEGGKTRIQKYTGVVIQKRNGKGMSGTFTVRKASANGVFVERIFVLNSPLIEAINVEARGHVRRARIYYLRERTGKSARIKELKTEFKSRLVAEETELESETVLAPEIESSTVEAAAVETPVAETVAQDAAATETPASDKE
jgi:large subunit ribosomal protein L19